MELLPSVLFPPFRLDLHSEQLWSESQVIELRPKTFAVLRYLTEHAGRLVTKDELLDAVWGQTVVSDTVLKSCIRELRKALGDEAQTPQHIETVHRRGYRFIAPLSPAPSVASSQSSVASRRKQRNGNWQLTTPLVGRETELAQLHAWFDKALSGKRQLVFVTGEPGIGKTTLVEAFLARLASEHELRITYGQCIEQHGAGEAYMPILEALGRLCRGPEGERLITLLHQYAPTWLVQMPALLNATELEALQRKVQGATRERMLREMVEAVDALTAERPLVLWLEDLHWSDPSTLELLALLARRQEPARLLVLSTYRPVDVIVREHPLRAVKQELQLHGDCQELPLRLLSEEQTAEYLAARFLVPSPANAGETCPEQSRRGQGEGLSLATLSRLAHVIHTRTEGNPLFMVTVVNEVVRQSALVQAEERWTLQGAAEAVAASVPESLRQMIERQFERLSAEEQRVLEVASVAGVEFSTAVVCAGVEAAVDVIEECCAALARRGHFLQAKGTTEWPDGTVATRYSFLHALYQKVIYGRIPAGRCINLHQRIGEREEIAYGRQAGEIAAELAVHFEWGRDYRRAVQYLEQAGKNAMRQSAHQEAITLLTKGEESTSRFTTGREFALGQRHPESG